MLLNESIYDCSYYECIPNPKGGAWYPIDPKYANPLTYPYLFGTPCQDMYQDSMITIRIDICKCITKLGYETVSVHSMDQGCGLYYKTAAQVNFHKVSSTLETQSDTLLE